MTHHFALRVYYEDTDMGGIVYHANYLKFIERARSEWVRSLGNDQNAMKKAGLVWVVRRVEADYLSFARFEDALSVETTIERLTGVRLVMKQLVLRDGNVIFQAIVTAVCMTEAGRPVRLPAEIRALMDNPN